MRQNCRLDAEPSSFQLVVPMNSAYIKPPFIVFEGGTTHARQNYFTSGEGEERYLLIYTISGTGTLAYANQPALWQLEKGSAVIIDCRNYHEYYSKHTESCDENWVFSYICFGGIGCAFYADILDLNLNEPKKIYVKNKINLAAHIDKIFMSLKYFDEYYQCLQAETVCQLLTLLTAEQFMFKKVRSLNSSHTETINDIAEYIDKNHWQPLVLENLAKNAGMSKYHFLRIFKEIMGVTPHKYMLIKRIDESKKIMETTGLSIHEVGMVVGFKDEGHFSRTFKNIMQITPLQYKKTVRK